MRSGNEPVAAQPRAGAILPLLYLAGGHDKTNNPVRDSQSLGFIDPSALSQREMPILLILLSAAGPRDTDRNSELSLLWVRPWSE